MKRIRYDLKLEFSSFNSENKKLYDASWICNVFNDEYEKALRNAKPDELPSLSIVKERAIRDMFAKEQCDGVLKWTYNAVPVDGA